MLLIKAGFPAFFIQVFNPLIPLAACKSADYSPGTINMEKQYIEDKNFDHQNYSTNSLPIAIYENCQFNHCNFSGVNVSGIHFIECSFINCNLSAATLNKTVFRDVVFKDSKLVGLHFENCDSFLISMAFDNCNLQLSSFYGLKLKKTVFQ